MEVFEPVASQGDPELVFRAPSGGSDDLQDGHRRIDNITHEAVAWFRREYGDGVSKDDIFYYCYGLLHSPEYRQMYEADLKKMLLRIPLVNDPWSFIDAGRELSELHLGYETIAPYPLEGFDVQPSGAVSWEFYRVQKMTFLKRRDPETKKGVIDRSTIVVNPRITVSGIPDEAYRYTLGSRSAIEWIMDRYQVKTDKASGIVNDPNDWAREASDPRYILDLLARIVTVSLKTVAIVDALPALDVIPAVADSQAAAVARAVDAVQTEYEGARAEESSEHNAR